MICIKNNILTILIPAAILSGSLFAQNPSEGDLPAVRGSDGSAALDIDAVIAEGSQNYVAADYSAARRGFEAVLKQEPGNPVALYYLSRIAAHQRRDAGEAAMNTVEKSWAGMIFRDYRLSAHAVEAMGLREKEEDVIDVRSEFPEVSFPEGAYAVYRPNLNRLFVQNTRTGMERMESLLALMEEPQKGDEGQVEIRARFVEFSEGALAELGFEWAADAAVDLGGDWSLPLVGGEGQELFSDSLRSVPYRRTGDLGLGEIAGARDSRTVPMSGGWVANRMEDSFGSEAAAMRLITDFGDNMDVVLRALEQTSGINVLSSPSLVTLSGQKASIKIGERHNFPMVYEEGATIGTVLHVRYAEFEEKLLGVEMDVTPTISGDNINLTINPKIIELAGWEQFELASADTSYSYYQFRVGMQFNHEPVVARLPVFKRREIQTEVSVSSGSTIGLGGLIGENIEAFQDRVPVLGSIPLIGRLFRSEGERRVKRNLMIFVTATNVDPSGRMLAHRSFE